MSALAHEAVGRVLCELGAVTEARRHFGTAIGLDPGRAQACVPDLARIDALEGDWASAERRAEALAADPDPPLAELGALTVARFMFWRSDGPAIMRFVESLRNRPGSDRAGLSTWFEAWQGGHTFDVPRWLRSVAVVRDPARARRQQLGILQRMLEATVVLGQPYVALYMLVDLAGFGLFDVVWMDKCPLLLPFASEPRFVAARAVVAARATRMLTAFRAVG